MDEKIPSRFLDEELLEPAPLAWYETEREMALARLKAQDDLSIRQFALDMAVSALPTLASEHDTEETMLRTVRHAAAEFEKILRGDEVG